MGLASSHGLGLALAQPSRRVIVLDGDGSLLMNLGTLVTIGKVAPQNLCHLVFQNGTYEANGGHPIPNQRWISRPSRAAPGSATHSRRDLANSAIVSTTSSMQRTGVRLRAVEQGPLGPRPTRKCTGANAGRRCGRL